jgi:predicted Fe-Mo cluster-binding NifX family protein
MRATEILVKLGFIVLIAQYIGTLSLGALNPQFVQTMTLAGN